MDISSSQYNTNKYLTIIIFQIMHTIKHPFEEHKTFFQNMDEIQRIHWNNTIKNIEQIDHKQLHLPLQQFPIQFLYKLEEIDYHISMWQPTKDPKGLLFIFPGLGYHVGNSCLFAKYMVQNCDLIVVGYDYKNYGKSGGNYRAEIPEIPQLLSTTQKIIDYINEFFNYKYKIYLSGHSLGGAICFKLALKNPQKYQAIIFFSPALRENKQILSIPKMFSRIVAKIWPGMKTVKQTSQNGVKYKSTNKIIENDPHIDNGRLVIGNVEKVLRFMDEIQTQYHLLTTPYLMIQSGVDKLVDPFLAIDLERKSSTKDKYTIICKDMWHTVWFEEQIFILNPVIAHWINLRN